MFTGFKIIKYSELQFNVHRIVELKNSNSYVKEFVIPDFGDASGISGWQ